MNANASFDTLYWVRVKFAKKMGTSKSQMIKLCKSWTHKISWDYIYHLRVKCAKINEDKGLTLSLSILVARTVYIANQ